MGYRPEMQVNPRAARRRFSQRHRGHREKKKLCEITSQRHACDSFLCALCTSPETPPQVIDSTTERNRHSNQKRAFMPSEFLCLMNADVSRRLGSARERFYSLKLNGLSPRSAGQLASVWKKVSHRGIEDTEKKETLRNNFAAPCPRLFSLCSLCLCERKVYAAIPPGQETFSEKQSACQRRDKRDPLPAAASPTFETILSDPSERRDGAPYLDRDAVVFLESARSFPGSGA
jgi:hypothetical protein